MSGRRESGRVDTSEGIRQALGKHVKILHKVITSIQTEMFNRDGECSS